MAKGSTYKLDILKLLLNATAIANIADNAASTPNTNLFVALHTADPTAGDQTTNEVAYTGYARVAVARSTSGWTATDPSTNVGAVTFPSSTSGPVTATWFSIGKLTSGAGEIYYTGQITTPAGGLIINPGIAPQFAAGTLSTQET